MKSSYFVCCTLWIGVLLSFSAHAEYGCQSGFVPVYQGNQQVCVADYNLPVWKQQGEQQQQPAEIWEDRYGAVAKQNGTTNYHISSDMRSARAAKKDALKRCGENCKVTGTFRNSCTALSWGPGKGGMSIFRGGGAQKEAEKKSVEACELESGGSCELIISTCSLPVRIQ